MSTELIEYARNEINNMVCHSLKNHIIKIFLIREQWTVLDCHISALFAVHEEVKNYQDTNESIK